MQLNDLLISVPANTLRKLVKAVSGSVYGTVGKIARFELTEKVKQEAIEQGLYHFVKDDETADLIIKSQYLKPSDAFTSYGRKCSFMFCGGPTIDNYSKNLTDDNAILNKNMWEKQINPYINPTGVATAIKITPREEDLANYKFRGLQDGVFMYEGYCILPPNSVEKVKMVPDLVRNKSGEPIKDNNGNLQLAFREAIPEELSDDGKRYNAKPDYLRYIKEKSIEYGYLHKDGREKSRIVTKALVVFSELGRMEIDESKQSIMQNGKDIAKSVLARIQAFFDRKPAISKSAEENLNDFSFRKKNPYRDKEFALAVADFQAKEGLSQLNLDTVLTEFTKSKEGEFFNKKHHQIESEITRTGIHGKSHANRTALLAMIIARNEKIIEDDSDNRIKDILLTAAMYHDIGRVLDSGPHAARGARKIAKMNLRYSNGKPYSNEDKKMVMALVEAHDGKPNKIDEMIKKYEIKDENNISLLKKLNSVVRDADALDRVRIDTNTAFRYKVNLNPRFLSNTTSKRLINCAYQL